MTSLDVMPSSVVRASAAAGTQCSVSVAATVEDVSRAWLSLEMSGLATPYQTLGWQRAALAALHPQGAPRIIVFRDRSGHTQALFPLVVERRRGIAIAAFPGGKHANYNMGLFAADAMESLTADDLREGLRVAARQSGIDLFALRNQPEAWRGAINPMSQLPHQPAASGAWRAELVADADAFIAAIMSSESRKKLRHKERKLADLGHISYAEAATPAEAQSVLDAFLAQKERRFAAQGIHNPFADHAARRFLASAAVSPLAGGPPAPISLFSMQAGGRILAIFGGIIHAGRFSGMFTSFDPDPAVAKYSPGDLLLMNLVKAMCARGLTVFDLGVGDAAYKSDYCPIREPLFDSFLPMTVKGRAAAVLLAGAESAKALAKRHDRALRPLLRLIRR